MINVTLMLLYITHMILFESQGLTMNKLKILVSAIVEIALAMLTIG